MQPLCRVSHKPMRWYFYTHFTEDQTKIQKKWSFYILLTLPSFFSFPKLLTISWTTAAPLWGSMPPNTQESRWPPRMTYLSRKHHCKITCHYRSRIEEIANDSIASKHKAFRTQVKIAKVPEDFCKCITLLWIWCMKKIWMW